MATFISAFFSFLFGFILTIILWDGIAGPESLGYLILFPLAGVLLLLMGLTGAFSKKREPEYYPQGIFIGLVLGAIASLLMEIDESINRSKPVVLEATYFNEEGIDLFLRSDGTFMVVGSNLMGTSREYGNYYVSGDTIGLSGNVKVNGDFLSAELFIQGNEIQFYRTGPNVRSPNPAFVSIRKNKLLK